MSSLVGLLTKMIDPSNDRTAGKLIILPVFLSLDGGIVLITSPTNEDIGNYEIKVCSTIYNSLLTKKCTKFDLDIIPAPQGQGKTVSV